jgi:hypothetical protein
VSPNGCIRTAKAVLEEYGFSIEENARVKGLSGFEHDFDLLARKGERIVCVSVRQANPTKMFAELVKGMDVKHEVIVLVEGEPPPKTLELAHEGRIKIVAFKNSEELTEKLRQLV